MGKWENTIEPPPEASIRRMHKDWRSFVRAGEAIAATISAEIKERLPAGKPVTLDFGCGFGRVYLPMHFGREVRLFGCDVNGEAVDYLRGVVQPPRIRKTSYEPPLPYADGFFDCVYSISIWTHLPPHLQIPWLEEIARVLRPGGLALVSTSGYRALESRRSRGSRGWETVTDDELQAKGMIYKERTHALRLPGITGSYGLTAHDPSYTRREWSRVMEVIEVKEAVVGGFQDLAIMARR